MLCKKCGKRIPNTKKHYNTYGNYCIVCDTNAETAGKRECSTGEIDFENLIWRTMLTCWHSTRNQAQILEMFHVHKKKTLKRVDTSNKN